MVKVREWRVNGRGFGHGSWDSHLIYTLPWPGIAMQHPHMDHLPLLSLNIKSLISSTKC